VIRCEHVAGGVQCDARADGRAGGQWLCARHVAEYLDARASSARRRAWLVAGVLIAAALADELAPVARVPITGAFFQLLIALVVAAFQYIGNAAVTVAVTIAQASIMIGTAIAHFSILVAGVFSRVWGFLGDFWSKALRPFLAWSWDQVQKLHAWLARTLKPVLDIVDRIRKYVDQIYRTWLKPIVDTIEATRRVFQLLAQLHVPFAREIDAKLAALESRLVQPIREVYARLNEAMNWINRIVDFNGYFQRLTLIASLVRYQRDALKVWWSSIHRPLSSGELAEYRKPITPKALDAAATETRDYVERGAGPDQARIDEHAADLALRLRKVGLLN
jgi:hypothetical protein